MCSRSRETSRGQGSWGDASAADVGYDDPYSSLGSAPFSHSLDALAGAASASLTVDVDGDSLDLGFDLARGSSVSSEGSVWSSVTFTVDAVTSFEASGAIAAVDPDGRRIYLSMELRDVTADASLFRTFQSSTSTPDEAFTAGLLEGDGTNELVGSLMGVLDPSHTYRLIVFSGLQVQGVAGTTSGATATGSAHLTLVPVGR